VTREQERRGALEAIERILNRGGEANRVVRDVLTVVRQLEPTADLAFLTPGTFTASSDPEERTFRERVALLVSPYVRGAQL